jgi:hypothetical protein
MADDGTINSTPSVDRTRTNPTDAAERNSADRVQDAARNVSDQAVRAQADKVVGSDGYNRAGTAGLQPTNQGVVPASSPQATVDAAVADLSRNSATARSLLADLQAKGGTVVASPDGGYTYTPANGSVPPKVTVRTSTPLRDLAHEIGHHDTAIHHPELSPVAPGEGKGPTDRAIEQRRQRDYLTTNTDRKLTDEGNATLISQQIRDEYKASTGRDIGVAGAPFPPVSGTPDEQRRALGEYYGKNLTTSNTQQPYQDYYWNGYRSTYERNFMPGQTR